MSESRESRMVTLRRKPDGTPSVWCDPEIADLVSALNAGGVPTVASCSGHGERLGNIALADGRELIIAKDYAEARAIEVAIGPPVRTVPEGWKLVPVQPNSAMVAAAHAVDTGHGSWPREAYRAMLAAAAAQQPKEGSDG